MATSKTAAFTPTVNDLERNLQLVTIGGAIKEAELTKAKRSLPAGTSYEVEVTVKIKAIVQIGQPTPASTYPISPSCNLGTREVFAEVLRRLDVTPAKLKSMLRAIVKGNKDITADPDNIDLLNALNQVESDAVLTMPIGEGRSPGRAAPVSSQIISLEFLPRTAAA